MFALVGAMGTANLILVMGKLTRATSNAEFISFPERFSGKQKRESKFL